MSSAITDAGSVYDNLRGEECEGNVDVSMGSGADRLVTPVFRVFTLMQFLSLPRSEMPREREQASPG